MPGRSIVNHLGKYSSIAIPWKLAMVNKVITGTRPTAVPADSTRSRRLASAESQSILCHDTSQKTQHHQDVHKVSQNTYLA